MDADCLLENCCMRARLIGQSCSTQINQTNYQTDIHARFVTLHCRQLIHERSSTVCASISSYRNSETFSHRDSLLTIHVQSSSIWHRSTQPADSSSQEFFTSSLVYRWSSAVKRVESNGAFLQLGLVGTFLQLECCALHDCLISRCAWVKYIFALIVKSRIDYNSSN